ncbi:MAG TPA: hypothetical protein VKV80_03480 [Streptosporangiaceae bacterium]|jgi:hypothetical protein|nr:hypothetical protein [Streptosporangiaceae bacterium]
MWATGAALPSLITKVLRDGSEKAFVLWDVKKLGCLRGRASRAAATACAREARPRDGRAPAVGEAARLRNPELPVPAALAGPCQV